MSHPDTLTNREGFKINDLGENEENLFWLGMDLALSRSSSGGTAINSKSQRSTRIDEPSIN